MPKGMDANIQPTLNGSSYIWGQHEGAFVRFPSVVLKGQDGANGINGINGTDGLDGASGYSITDNTGASTDLLLAAGDVAYIDYSGTGAFTTNLYIQQSPGIYELTIVGNYSVTSGSNTVVTLMPNHTNITPTGNYSYGTGTTLLFTSTETSTTGFRIGDGVVYSCKATISTITNSKSVTANYYCKQASALYTKNSVNYNTDTSTAWGSSLGTLTFPCTQSGKIVVRRII